MEVQHTRSAQESHEVLGVIESLALLGVGVVGFDDGVQIGRHVRVLGSDAVQLDVARTGEPQLFVGARIDKLLAGCVKPWKPLF